MVAATPELLISQAAELVAAASGACCQRCVWLVMLHAAMAAVTRGPFHGRLTQLGSWLHLQNDMRVSSQSGVGANMI
jgi:hypothetical protein